jgi:hypothetical protein
MKILVIGGMHGNEPLGLEIVKLLNQQQNPMIDTILANNPAIQQGVRFCELDLNRSFPGDALSQDYEPKRAAEILEACEAYDVVFDFHNTHCPDNDCSFVGETADSLLYDISDWLGLSRVIVADYACLNKFAANCISIEISLASDRMSAEKWVAKITELAALHRLPEAKTIERYKFVYRLTLEDRDKYSLQSRNLKAFRPLTASLAVALGFTSTCYPIFIGDRYTPYNFGGLLTKIDV